VYLLIVARQRIGRNVTAVTNTHATLGVLLDASFSLWPVSYEGKQAISSSQNFLYFFQNKEIWLKIRTEDVSLCIRTGHLLHTSLDSVASRPTCYVVD
jgi:hypothetical protein